MAELIYSHEVQNMCVVAKGPNHGPAPIPEEGMCPRYRTCISERPQSPLVV